MVTKKYMYTWWLLQNNLDYYEFILTNIYVRVSPLKICHVKWAVGFSMNWKYWRSFFLAT